MKLDERNGGRTDPTSPVKQNGIKRTETLDSSKSDKSDKAAYFNGDYGANGTNGSVAPTPGLTRQPTTTKPPAFEPQVGYRQWVAQAGTLIADLLTCAGADHVITMDLHGMYSLVGDGMIALTSARPSVPGLLRYPRRQPLRPPSPAQIHPVQHSKLPTSCCSFP
jgi:hypothetical protein